ncbi:MAG: prepilin-type N-terminal cleavage/methylation domain-containing protein [Actinobacteria bacterium]|nr:prepilin-type N-terminal cleavage/methylation domain-containing protein [Actinomycetota bacterium]
MISSRSKPQHTTRAINALNGFSAIECLITLAIISTLMLTGFPRLTNVIIAKRTEVAATRIFESVYEARGYAVNAGAVVILCPGSPQTGCVSQIDWSIGWFSFVDVNRNSKFDSAETVLSHQSPIKHLTVRWRTPFWVRFKPFGDLWPNGHFAICDENRKYGTAVVVHRTGRARISPNFPDGEKVRCK